MERPMRNFVEQPEASCIHMKQTENHADRCNKQLKTTSEISEIAFFIILFYQVIWLRSIRLVSHGMLCTHGIAFS